MGTGPVPWTDKELDRADTMDFPTGLNSVYANQLATVPQSLGTHGNGRCPASRVTTCLVVISICGADTPRLGIDAQTQFVVYQGLRSALHLAEKRSRLLVILVCIVYGLKKASILLYLHAIRRGAELPIVDCASVSAPALCRSVTWPQICIITKHKET